jgi:MFS family permease
LTQSDPLLIDEDSSPSSLPHENASHEIQEYQNFHVTLLSIFSFTGRISVGSVSDFSKYMYNLRRLWFLLVSGSCILIGQILAGFIIKDLNHLWISTIFIGFGYGNLFGIGPTITSDWFGSKYFGFNWGIISWVSFNHL